MIMEEYGQGQSKSSAKDKLKKAEKKLSKKSKGSKQAEETRQIKDELEASKDMSLRLQAEIQNLHKRAAQEVNKARIEGLSDFATVVIDTLDNLEKALSFAGTDKAENLSVDSISKGVELTYKTLQDGLKRFGIEEINPADQQFNPELHEAISRVKVEGKNSGTVITVIQKGYILDKRLLRAAKVQVAE